MTKLSTHKRWKGCCMLGWKWRTNGAVRTPWKVMRATGQKRKLTKTQDGW